MRSEVPVSAVSAAAYTIDDLHGPAQIRTRAPEGMDIAAGEYGYTPLLLDGASKPQQGLLSPDRARPGLGLTLRASDAARYAVKSQA